MKILALDIETRPAVAYTWRMWDVTIAPNQLIQPGGTLCFGAKWVGEPEEFFYSDWEHGHEEMLRNAHRLLSEADAVLTYNGDRFDLPKLRGEFLLAGLNDVPKITSIDVLKTVKKLGFDMNRLAFIGPLLNIGRKMKHEGFELWTKVLAGEQVAQRKMQRYCMQDVKLLEKVYKKVRPFILNHPHLGKTSGKECGACGSKHLQSRGFYRTKMYKTQRIQCQSCGSWSTGTRTKV